MTDARPDGDQLVGELRLAARREGVPLQGFVRPLIGDKANPWAFIHQLERAKLPTPATIERVRALCAGRPIPDHRGKAGLKGTTHDGVHRVTDGESRLNNDEIARRRSLAEAAHAERMPGETIAAAVARLRHSQATIASLGEDAR